MLKKYAVDQLKEGMVIGQAVHKEDMSVLLGEGTALNQQMIDSLSEEKIASVEILEGGEEEAVASAPRLRWKRRGRRGRPFP